MEDYKSDLVFLPLGGCGEIGMNLNLIGHGGRWLAIDCGITLEHQLGSLRPSVQMPDPSFIQDRRNSLEGLLITHSHEDHLGAIPYLWPKFECPVYATPFAAAMLRYKTQARKGRLPKPLIEIKPGESIKLGPFGIEFVPITHSTPETCALWITTKNSKLLHTADWKIDTEPVVGEAWSSSRFRMLSREGVDAIICDSTNALLSGRSASEGQVAIALKDVIASKAGRVIIGCFSSNIARIQTISNIAGETGRHLGILGRSLVGAARCAQQTGLMSRSFKPIHSEHLGYLPRGEVLALATGSQGELGAALHRLMADTHPDLALESGDTVILSSKTIPGNERLVERLSAGFIERGIELLEADKIDTPLHASGHPCEEELRELYLMMKPKLVVPVHGERKHMERNAWVARQAGVLSALTGTNGDLFYLSPNPGVRRAFAKVGRIQWSVEERRLMTLKKREV